MRYSPIFIFFLLIACNSVEPPASSLLQLSLKETKIEAHPYEALFDQNPTFISDGFDFPVGIPNAKGYYNAQGFTKNGHLGDDWNAVTGGNSDLGDPIYTIANGYVSYTLDLGGGWGNVIKVIHKMPSGKYLESLYAHCDSIITAQGAWVKRGDLIGTIGNAHGQYLAHLHLELRDSIGMPIGGGYSNDTEGYLDPTAFIEENRPKGSGN